jgi:hypothetical protein
MKKKLNFRFFIPLVVIIFSGYGQLFAGNLVSSRDSFSLKSTIVKTDFTIDNQVDLDVFTYTTDQPFSGKMNFKLRATDNEVEEDEQISSKKELISNNYFAAFFQPIEGLTCFTTLKKKATYSTFIHTFFPCKKYVLFQVFRI